MILTSIFGRLFSRKKAAPSSQEAVMETAEQCGHDAIVEKLMALYEQFNSLKKRKKGSSKSFRTTGNHQKLITDDGSYVIRNEEGQIIETRDALFRVVEFRYEADDVYVKKFGVWSKLDSGSIQDDGTLVRRTRTSETHERIDGTQIFISFKNESLISKNEKTGEEIALNGEGTLRHSRKEEGVERFRVFQDGRLMSETEMYERPTELSVRTIAEVHQMSLVSRVERTYENDGLAFESYSYLNPYTGDKSTRMCINLPATGERLYVATVSRVENTYRDGALVETMYHLSDPVSITRDKAGLISLIDGVGCIRRFQLHEDETCAVVFIDKNGDENLYFPLLKQ